MDLVIGSNLFKNTNGVVEIEGVHQFNLSLKPSNKCILLNFVLFDRTGRMVAKLVDNTLAFNERRAYEVGTTPTSVELKEMESGTVVIRASRAADDRVTIDRGQFWTIKGHLCTITPSECKIDKHSLKKEETDAQGGSSSLGG